jgi:hypothetical protein
VLLVGLGRLFGIDAIFEQASLPQFDGRALSLLQASNTGKAKFMSLKDRRAAAQVDETRACLFLQQGRVTDAEHIARLAVQNQEKSAFWFL